MIYIGLKKKRGSFIIKQTYVNGQLEKADIVTHESDVVRNKWEVVETPIKFDESVFRQWL
jgi:hypothetical protein